jgi:hypothetical protein
MKTFRVHCVNKETLDDFIMDIDAADAEQARRIAQSKKDAIIKKVKLKR